MKKMFTLALILGLMAAATAQPRPAQNGQFAPAHQGITSMQLSAQAVFGKPYLFTLRERNRSIARINRAYNRKIRREKNRLFISRFEKARRMNQLARQRDFEIRSVNARYYSPLNRYHKGARKSKTRW
jgi:hypothetical protein